MEPKCLEESASYELRLGSRYRLGGSDSAEWLTNSKKDLHIPPHDIAMVSTYEWLNIPGCLIARWNLRVRMVYRGLVWVGSLQVDPGYQGFLSCPIYNLSDREQVLIYKDPLFIIDFVLTTPAAGKYELWKLRGGKYSSFDFDRLDEQKIGSAPATSFKKQDTKIDTLANKIERFQDTILVVVGVIVAAIAIIATFSLTNTKLESNWMDLAIAGSALALSVVAIIIAWFNARSK
jgi:deoxycytidine triphosphate deaminase